MTDRDMRQEWETPDDFFKVIDREFHFKIDVCATRANAKCALYHSLYDDGINALKEGTPWIMPDEGILSAWCNPGFSKPKPWVKKAFSEAQKHPMAVVVVVGLISPPAGWWRDWASQAAEIRLIGGRRIQFRPPPGIKPSSNSRENCVMIFRQSSIQESARIWTWDWTK